MDSQPEDSYGYPTDTDAGQPMDDAGDELLEGPDGIFDVLELEVLARRRREWTQAGKKEKPSIMREICKEFAKMEKHQRFAACRMAAKGGGMGLRCLTFDSDIEYILLANHRMAQKANEVKEAANNFVRELYHDQVQLKHSNMKIEGGTQATKRIDLYQQALSAFIQEDLTDEQRQAAHDIAEKWNGPDGPTPEVQARNAKKYGLKYMRNFAGGDVAVLRDEDRFFGRLEE
ncbi:hypothetical protein EV401DRAFT_2081763 [Pisolithus croceorrhizus]|nr:hypothetical protein EV401DRAFT_2081763 [Pisolithus croceorrhizus]